ncbi:FAD-binding protein [Paenibacillus sp. JNUCC32]|nr:FAD-binding protein [Paenibacillus sp. JNUCC-32]
MAKHDVAIVGGGIAGLTAAHYLARGGKRVGVSLACTI